MADDLAQVQLLVFPAQVKAGDLSREAETHGEWAIEARNLAT